MKALFAWLALLLIFAGAAAVWFGWKALQPSRAEAVSVQTVPVQRPGADEEWLTEFTLTERSGRSFDSAELDGQVHVVSFFFATCPHYCTFQNQKLDELHDEFGPQGVKFLSITCDPQNDTPERLAEYAKTFEADPEQWLFLTGDIHYLKRIGAEMYQVAVAPQTHTERLMVVDRWGEIRGRFHWNNAEDISKMKKLLQELLAETEPPQTTDNRQLTTDN